MRYSLIKALLENRAAPNLRELQQVFADYLSDIDVSPKKPDTREWVKQVVQMCGSGYTPIRKVALQLWDNMQNASWMLHSCDQAPQLTLVRAALDCLTAWFEESSEDIDQEHRDLLQSVYLWCEKQRSVSDVKQIRRLCQRAPRQEFMQIAIRDLADAVIYPKQTSTWTSQVVDRASEYSSTVRASAPHIVRRHIPDPSATSGGVREGLIREGHADLVSDLQNFAAWLVSKGRRKETAIQYATEVAEIVKLAGSDDRASVEEMIRSLPDDVRSTLTTKGTIRKKRYITAWNAFQKFRSQSGIYKVKKSPPVSESTRDLADMMQEYLTEQLSLSIGSQEGYDHPRRQVMGGQPFRSSAGSKKKLREGGKDDGSGTYGHGMPTFKGSFFGQSVSGEQKKGKPKFIPIVDKETGEETTLPVRSKDIQCYWTWDGERWLTDEQWKAKYASAKPGGFKKPPGMKLR